MVVVCGMLFNEVTIKVFEFVYKMDDMSNFYSCDLNHSCK